MNVTLKNPKTRVKPKAPSKIYQFRAGKLGSQLEYLAKKKNTNLSQLIKAALQEYIEKEDSINPVPKNPLYYLSGTSDMTLEETEQMIKEMKESYIEKDFDYELFN